MTAVEQYRWIVDYEQSYLAIASCVTSVRGLDVAGTVRAFGGDPSAEPEPLERFLRGDDDDFFVAAGPVGEAVVGIELNGFEGSRPEVLRGASARGMAVSVFWNVNAVSRFSYAVGGEVVTTFEPLFPEQRSGSDPDRLLPHMADLDFKAPNETIPASFALAERVTGVRLGRDDLLRITDVWRVVPLLRDFRPLPPPEYRAGELAELVAAAGRERQREVAAMVAERVVRAVGLDGEPGVAETLAGLRTSPPQPLPPEAAWLVRRLLHRSSLAWFAVNSAPLDPAAAIAAAQERTRLANAANALYQATNPDPLAAALETLSLARGVLGEGVADEVRRQISRPSPPC